MRKPEHIIICGAGLTGVLAAWLIRSLDPSIRITLFDAGPEPRFSHDSGKLGGHFGATLGSGRNARHFTGTEGLSFQNPVCTQLLFETAGTTSQGLCTIPEHLLTDREKRWRAECLARFERDVDMEYNPYDRMYVSLNYGGLSAWHVLTKQQPELRQHRLSNEGVYIALDKTAALQKVYEFERALNPFQATDPVAKLPFLHIYQGLPSDVSGGIVQGLVRIPGEAWAIQSLWSSLYKHLCQQQDVIFAWLTPVTSLADLPSGDAYIWAAGSGHSTPDLYSDFGRVQGIGGWWFSAPNPGFTQPFKFVTPQPCGVINVTPKNTVLHVSGGFGWVGERHYDEAKLLMLPIKHCFIREASRLLDLDISGITDVDCCIRPATPTGLPDIAVHMLHDRPHITLSGAGKAGATQAPLLAMYAAKEVGLGSQLAELISRTPSRLKRKLIARGLTILDHKLDLAKLA